jgi:hypothetical protein
VMKTLENMIVVEVVRVVGVESVGCGSSSLRKESKRGLSIYTRRVHPCVI